MRRVVTGHHNGKSVILEDKDISSDGRMFTLWKTEGIPVIPLENEDYKQPLVFKFPKPEGTLVCIWVRPPDETILKEAREKGLDSIESARKKFNIEFEKKFNEDWPMHTTDTIDYNIVLSGEIWMVVDDGKEVHLKPYDCVVQNGTRHCWRNKSSENCVMASVIIGAKRIKN